MKVIYTDKSILVVYKEYGESSEMTYEKAPENVLESLDSSVRELFTVHRLDATTCGLMVYALDKKSAAALTSELENGELHKTYTAFVQGEPEPPSGEMRDLLFYDRSRQKSFVTDRKRNNVKEALLTYETEETLEYRGNTVSRVKVNLITGRTHQIRVQFSSRKHPLVGDGKYGSRINTKSASLFSTHLTFLHPKTSERLEFDASAEAKLI